MTFVRRRGVRRAELAHNLAELGGVPYGVKMSELYGKSERALSYFFDSVYDIALQRQMYSPFLNVLTGVSTRVSPTFDGNNCRKGDFCDSHL